MEISKEDISRLADIANAEIFEANKPHNRIKYLEERLTALTNLSNEQRETIDQLKEALKKTSFQAADRIPQSPPVIGNKDLFNLSVNKAYVILK